MSPPVPLLNLSATLASGDLVDVRQFHFASEMSALFEATVLALCDNWDVDLEAVSGQDASLTLRWGLAGSRTIRGIVRTFRQVQAEETGRSTYQWTIVPTLWLTTQRRNHRMFQQMSEIDIVLKILGEWGITPILKLSETYKKRKYRVQYGESDFAFLSRMLEDAGISYFFDPEDGTSTMVLHDAPQSASPRPLNYREHAGAGELPHVSRVRVGRRVRPGKLAVRDHDYRRPPSFELVGKAESGAGVEQSLERFHYEPGSFLFESSKGESTPNADDKGKYRADMDEGTRLAERRLESKRATAKSYSFETNLLSLTGGATLSLLDHPRSDLGPDKKLLVLGASLSGEHDSEWKHACEAVSGDVPYRPATQTPKPKTSGVESATVVGPPGEEIHTDEFGRVRVHFHWDRESAMNQDSSCWIHVSQPWGGSGFGMVNIPRIGQEVIVDFLGGDPDRPIIVGRVFTNVQKPPFPLPANKTQSGWKSNSSPGGGGYNEMMFEDGAGKELVRMQAQKDLKKLVKNDEAVNIGRNRAKNVGNDDAHTVGNNRNHTIGNNETITVGTNQTITIGNNQTETIGVNQTLTVGADQTITLPAGNQTESITGNRTFTLVGDLTETITGNSTLTQTGNQTETLTGNRTETITGDWSITQTGNLSVTRTGNQSLILQGDQSHIQVGSQSETVLGERSLLHLGSQSTTRIGNEVYLQLGSRTDVEMGSYTRILIGSHTETIVGDSTLSQSGSNTEEISVSKMIKAPTIGLEGATVTVKGDTVNINGSAVTDIKGGVIKLNC